MVVASSKPPRPLKLSRRQLRGVWSVTSDQQRKTLERAELSQARIAVVLGEESSERSDWRATSSALAVDRVAPQVHTVVAVLGRSCCENLHSLRANEVVVTGTLGERLVSQCAITPGISAVYNELLTFGMGSQEVYLGPIPRPLGGKTFRDIRRELMDEEIVPVGYRSREGEFRVNPRADDRVLGGSAGEGWDELVFIADNRRALPGAGGWKGSPDLTPGSRKKGMTMPTSQKKSTSHAREATIGVCGWGSEARSVIEQLRESVIAAHQRFSVTVIDEPERLGFAETRNGDLHEHVRFVVGDPTRKRVLENAGLREFRSLVILADRSGDEAAVYSDHRALMIALSATALNPSLHIIVELLHSKNREHFEHMPTVEVVSVEELAEKLLAQAVVNPGITEVYLELLTATADSNEVYIVPVPAAWVGRSFRDVYADLLEAEEAMIPIGYRVPAPAGNGQVVVLNPGRKEQTRNGVSSWKGYELSEDDGLVVISYEQPDLATLAARLAEKA